MPSQPTSAAPGFFFSLRAFDAQWQPSPVRARHSNSRDIIELYWVVSGTGHIDIDGKKTKLEAQQLLCLLPGQSYRFFLEDTFIAYNLCFSPALPGQRLKSPMELQALQELLLQSHGLRFDAATAPEIPELMQQIQREAEADRPLKLEMLGQYLNTLLCHCQRQVAQQPARASADHQQHRLINRFFFLLEQHFIASKRVHDYAKLLCITPTHLNFIVKRATGHTAGYHIRQRIVTEAQRHALCSDDSMKQIAMNLGFEDMAHFSKFFKKATGTNFTGFKKAREAAPVPLYAYSLS